MSKQDAVLRARRRRYPGRRPDHRARGVLHGGLPVAFSRAAGPDELQYVPANAAVVAYANVREVHEFRTSASGSASSSPNTAERDEFEQKTGVNIEQDIETVVAAMMPGADRADTARNMAC